MGGVISSTPTVARICLAHTHAQASLVSPYAATPALTNKVIQEMLIYALRRNLTGEEAEGEGI
ncbi:hypothetical protein E2C01_085263 [Portunus trituberculatus]|uniref:Uncharacterized protein n=1 Tax=Portunus trituberculatus TaxID=210409 RepID=A0A5B7J8D8_PORTR|nr:hypothetical protein [Portunus trituberculatus]